MNSNDGWCVGAAGKRISEEEGNYPLMPSSTNVAVWVGAKSVSEEVDGVCSSVFSSSCVGGGLEQLSMNMQAQSVCSRCEVSSVINTRLELVITPRWFLSEAVVRAACTLTTSSMLPAVGCVGVDAQLALVASTSVGVRSGF
jgi:hypothetical protein